MKAAVYYGPEDLRVEDTPEPGAPAADEVTIAIKRAAVCGTDSSEWDHGPLIAIPPVILGHEFMGEVTAVGGDVTTFAVGDRVVCGAGVSCGTCEWCAVGRTNLCSSYHTLGLHINGGLAEYVNAPASTLIPVPDDVSDDVAVLAQPFAVGNHAVNRSGVTPDQVLVVIGAGGIGAFIIAAAKAAGVKTLIAIDIDDERLQTATKLGASTTINATGLDLAEAILGATGEDGPDVIIEATGVAHAPQASFSTVKRGGRVLIVGLQAAPREVDLFDLTLREIEVTTTLAHVIGEDLAHSLEVLRTTDVYDIVIGSVISLDEIVEKAIKPLAGRTAKGKIVVDVTR